MGALYIKVLLCILGFHVGAVSTKQHPQAHLEFVKYCQYFNYPVEEHKVVTKDGYILGVFRIQKRYSKIVEGKQPILMLHGLMDSSDTFIVNQIEKAPAFLLADSGYDVWLANSRGNKHSRAHQTLNPDKDKQFWKFTFQHMAIYDMPALFKYIYQRVNAKINFIGHSQGCTIMIVALALRIQQIKPFMQKCFLLAPLTYNFNQQSKMMDTFQNQKVMQFFKIMGIQEVMPSWKWFQSDAGILFCSQFKHFCTDIVSQIMDGDPRLDNYERYDVIVGHDPSGSSLMNLEHWAQLHKMKYFNAYDYGSAQKNQQAYGQNSPPQFKISNIDYPLRIFAGTSDKAADLQDIAIFWNQMRSQYKQYVGFYSAGHGTFVWGINTQPWMNQILMQMKGSKVNINLVNLAQQ